MSEDALPVIDVPLKMALEALTAARYRAEAAEARISDLERDGPMVDRGERGDGTRVMGTMRQAWEDAIQAADVEARLGDEARVRVADLEQQLSAAQERAPSAEGVSNAHHRAEHLKAWASVADSEGRHAMAGAMLSSAELLLRLAGNEGSSAVKTEPVR